MPKPQKGESKEVYVSRCISYVIKNEGLSKKEAAGRCYGMWKSEKKDFSFREIDNLVYGAWSEQYGNQEPWSWVTGVYDGYVIISAAAHQFKIPWTMEGSDVVFDVEAAQEVEHEWVPVERRLIASPIKAVEGKQNLYKAYAIKFGSPEKRDAYGTWFDADTEYCLDWYKTRPWLYHHGQNRFIKTDKIGDWVEVGQDDEGLFFLGEMVARMQYLEDIQVLQEADLLYPSSGTLSYVASPPDKTGYIRLWPIEELSSTVAPAEFRIEPISKRATEAIRSLRR